MAERARGHRRPEPASPASAGTGPWVVVIGMGNALRGDDAAGLELVRALRTRADVDGVLVREHEGEALGLLEQWEGAQAAVLVDAVRSGAAPGTIHRIDASSEPLPAELRSSSSTHAIGMAEAVELARALGCLPPRVVVYGVEGGCFDAGSGLSEEVRAATARLADMVFVEACALAGCAPAG